MLQITKIIEGGIDLTSGQKIEQGIVINNGQQEMTIPVSPDAIEQVVMLYAQSVQSGGNGHDLEPPQDFGEFGAMLADPPPQQMQATPSPVPQPKVSVVATPDSDYEEAPPSSDIDEEEGFQPGEDYADSGTGVGSL